MYPSEHSILLTQIMFYQVLYKHHMKHQSYKQRRSYYNYQSYQSRTHKKRDIVEPKLHNLNLKYSNYFQNIVYLNCIICC